MKKILAIVLAVVMLLPVFAVNVFAEEVPVFNNEEGKALSDCTAAWDFFGMGGLWGREAANVLDISVDDLKKILNDGGATFKYVCGGTPAGWFGTPKAVLNGDFDNGVEVTVKELGSGKYEGSVKLDDVVKKWTELGHTVDEVTSFVIQSAFDKIVLYSADFVLPEEVVYEDKVMYEYKCGEDGIDFENWKDMGVAVSDLISALSRDNARIEIEAEVNGDWAQLCMQGTGWKSFTVSDLATGLNVIPATTVLEKLKEKDPNFDFSSIIQVCSNGGPVTYKSFKVIVPVPVETTVQYVEKVVYKFNCGEEGKTFNTWSDMGIPAMEVANALKMTDAKIVVDVAVDGDWAQLFMQGTGWKSFKLIDLADGINEISAATVLEALQGADPNFTFDSIIQVVSNGGPVTYKSFEIIATVAVPVGKKPIRGMAFAYINEDMHAYRNGKQFVPMPHVDNGAGFCNYCNAVIPTEVEEGGDKSVFVLEKTGGQDYQDASLAFADGVVLADKQENNNNARIATNWVDGDAYNGIVNAVKTEGAWLKITYTGKLNSVIFQTANNASPEEFETTVPATVEEGEQNVAWFNCADIVANSPNGLSGAEGWANFMLNFEGETTVYGFEVVVPEVVPVAE